MKIQQACLTRSFLVSDLLLYPAYPDRFHGRKEYVFGTKQGHFPDKPVPHFKLSCSSSIPHAIIPDWWFPAKKSLTMFDCVEQALCSMSPLYSLASTHTISSQGKILDPMAKKEFASTNGYYPRYLLDRSILLLCVYPSIPNINEDSIFPNLPTRSPVKTLSWYAVDTNNPYSL